MNPDYKMTVNLAVLDHLGLNLYSNVAAVLTEVVANSWDADATEVRISISHDPLSVQIEDNGIGMSQDDINKKYLYVGYARRSSLGEGRDTTTRGRKVMGRKGIGKLSLFSIAESVTIQSAVDNSTVGCRIYVPDIRKAIDDEEPEYNPKSLDSYTFDAEHGTQIRLDDIKRERLGPAVRGLRKRLARRFSVIGGTHDFRVFIDDEEITVEDREDLRRIQFLWTLGSDDLPDDQVPLVIERASLPSRLDTWPEDHNLGGWLGTTRKPSDLSGEHTDSLNTIVVMSRGRIFHENILQYLNLGQLYSKYLTGQIEADFLDDTDQRDIATSDRQRIQEDDTRFTNLLQLLRRVLSTVESDWTRWRRDHEVARVAEEHPAIEEWLTSLRSGHADSARLMIARIGALPLDREDDRKELYRHGIFAFERMRLRGRESAFVDTVDDPARLLQVLEDQDSYEASLYLDIVRSRLDAIDKLRENVDINVIERVLQEYLFEHLWLLDPAWDRVSGSERMESRLKEENIIVADLTKKEELARVDIAYRSTANKHVIVELKRAGRTITLRDIEDQGRRYVDKVKKIASALNQQTTHIEVVFVLGTDLAERVSNPDRYTHALASISPGSRTVTYDALIQNASDAYGQYVEEREKVDRVSKILEKL